MTNTSIKIKSHFSCGRAIGTPKQYLKVAKEKGITHLGLSDFCTLGGALDFYNTFKGKDVKLAIGVDFNIDSTSNPITLFCKNQNGYTNLCRLVTLANKNNQVLNVQDLYDHHSDLICLSSEITHEPQLATIFHQDLYFELTPYADRADHNFKIIQNININQIIISSDAYMPNAEDKILQDIMVQNSTFGKVEMLTPYPKYMMGTLDLLQKITTQYPNIPQPIIIAGLQTAQKIVDTCSDLELKFQDQIVNYPHLLHPLNPDGVDKETLLRRIIVNNKRWVLEEKSYQERLEYEIDAITNNDRVNLIDYFLVLEDLCRYCSDNDIPVGPGRGSGAGSLVLYGLMVTHLDPIEYGLLFERFISKGRIEAGSLPDVDLDFADQEVVRQYLINLYGEDRVKPIGTYQTLAFRGALKDAFRTLYPEVDFRETNRITKAIDDDIEADTTEEFFAKQMSDNDAFSALMDPYPKVIEAVSKLVGYNRQPGIHPCGLAITQDPIENFMPIRITKGKQVLEYQADHCEQSGIIKYDILGLKTLKFFQTCLRLISERYQDKELKGLKYPKSIYDIPLDDRETFKAFERGDTESVFQFNSNVAKNILTKIKITSLDDLSMVTSVGRPGPMENGQHNAFIKRKNNPALAKPPHPALKDLLKDTFGIMIYQESVMKCAQLMGGYSLAETDNIRKAMGKKKIEILMPYKEGFIKHCKEKYPDTQTVFNCDEKKERISVAEHIWNLMETFSGYGFNKSHSMCYALIGYYCQYLKVHYPLEWWCACLTHAGDPKHTKQYYMAYKHRIILPSVLHSNNDYSIVYEKDGITDENGDDVEGFIAMPFSAVKGLGEVAAASVTDNAPYSSFEDFYNRAKSAKGRRVNKGVVLNLIFANAFTAFEDDPQKLVNQYYELRKEKKIPDEHKELTKIYLAESRARVLDFLTLDYIDMYAPTLEQCKYPHELKDLNVDYGYWIVGKIVNINKRKIQRGENKGCEFAILEVLNDDANYNVVVWPEQYGFYSHLVQDKQVVVIEGKVKRDYMDKVQFTARSIYTIEDIKKSGGLRL